MDELKNELQDYTIEEIYCNNDDRTPVEYRVPVYQRNYAWGHDEICALIEDVYDSMSKSKESVYYIGTLVTFKRDDNVFEVIDGQQRLTTIFIILCALNVKVMNKLTYSARKASTQTIRAISGSKCHDAQGKEDIESWDEYDVSIHEGYKCAKKTLDKIGGDKREDYKNYFLKKVHIIRYRVPKDVDLNHYFEVMNSRGEQLEKHEIVKAKLSNVLKADNKAMNGFCQIWEACSEMRVYIQQKLQNKTDNQHQKSQKQIGVFETVDGSSKIPENFDEVCRMLNNNDDAGERQSIESMLEESVNKEKSKDEVDRNDYFQPVIDFPNFLLIVLKITIARLPDIGVDPLDITLDDKELINEFEKVKKLTPDFVKSFAYNLLLAKYFLDNYMVHHISDAERTEENPWKLQIYSNDKDRKYEKRNFFEDDAEQNEKAHLKQRELVNLLSMFEVTFSARQRKNYLFYCLLFLFDNSRKDDYLVFVRKLADKYFFDVYLDTNKLNERKQPKPDSFDATLIHDGKVNVELGQEACNRNFDEVYPKGCDTIPLYVFDYSDYRLWKKYAEDISGKSLKKGDDERTKFFDELGCSDFGLEKFKLFYFSRTRKSLEHYYPQAKAAKNGYSRKEDGEEDVRHRPTLEEINCFGNFAMIGSDANSSGSDWDPQAKIALYRDSKIKMVSTASLKLMVMMQICQDNCERDKNGEAWNVDDMRVHQKKMLSIVMKPTMS